MSSPVRILTAVPICDGHDSAINTINLEFIRHGIEVVYLGIHNTAEEIVQSAVQEDVDAIGISIHSAAHLSLFQDLANGLKRNKANDILLFGGGIVPAEDLPALKKFGVKKIFGPGAAIDEIVAFVKAFPGRGRSSKNTAAKRHEL